jgi:hypothetical protein
MNSLVVLAVLADGPFSRLGQNRRKLPTRATMWASASDVDTGRLRQN